MRKLPILTVAALMLTGAVLTGCGNAPGSVAGDPLAIRLIDAEKKMQQWDGVEMSMNFNTDGALSGRTLPCLTMTTSNKPSETFTMDYVSSPSSSSECSGSPQDTVTIDYSGSAMYVTDPSGYSADRPEGCQATVTSHQVSTDLAEEFVSLQTNQAKMADLMKAATDISGDDHTISVAIDTEAMMKLGKNSIPSGADPDDIDVTAVAEVDAAGAMTSLTMVIDADGQGSISILTQYAKASAKPTMPPDKCVTEGSPAHSTDDIQGYLS